MKKAPQAKIFVIESVFTPKIAQKCKYSQQKIHPPRGGTENVFILGIPPAGGVGLQKNPPPHWGGFTPSLSDPPAGGFAATQIF